MRAAPYVALALAVLLTAQLSANADDEDGPTGPKSPARFQLVGFTSSSALPADTGVLGFTLECQKEFPESRMCTSEEVMETTAVPSSLQFTAWLRPSFAPIGIVDSRFFGTRDASGVSLVSELITEVVDSSSDLRQVLRKARMLASELRSVE